ncbi:MAG: alpha/beta hydrolase [Hymenobacter sp.]|nr:MAG: alpha/beta hydrolase [Hymenobacter sp.]
MVNFTSGLAPLAAATPRLPYPAPTPPTVPLTKEQVLRRNNVRIVGHGKPPMLLCNGFGYNQRLWQPLVAALAQQHQVILFDHVGTGESDLTAYDFDKYAQLAGYAQDMLDICRVLELEGAVLVGHSVGSTIALLAASQAPAYFTQVVLLTPSPCYLNGPGYYGGYERADLEQLLTLLATDYRSWANLFVDLLLGPLALSSLAEELHHCLSPTASPMAQQFARVTFLSDHRADVPRLHLPTLVVQCPEDFIAPAQVGDYLVAHLPQAQLVTLSAAGHCPQLSAPLETLAALRTFLQLEAKPL